MGKIIYIAGPMTGLPDYNRKAFSEASEKLKQDFANAAIINPAENFGGNLNLDYATYMRMSIYQVLTADMIYMLSGWMESRGAILEHRIAELLKISIIYEQT